MLMDLFRLVFRMFSSLRDLVDVSADYCDCWAYFRAAVPHSLVPLLFDCLLVLNLAHLYVYKPAEYSTDRPDSPGLFPALTYFAPRPGYTLDSR